MDNFVLVVNGQNIAIKETNGEATLTIELIYPEMPFSKKVESAQSWVDKLNTTSRS